MKLLNTAEHRTRHCQFTAHRGIILHWLIRLQYNTPDQLLFLQYNTPDRLYRIVVFKPAASSAVNQSGHFRQCSSVGIQKSLRQKCNIVLFSTFDMFLRKHIFYTEKKFSKHFAAGHVCLFLVVTQRGRFGQCTSVGVQADLLQTCNILFFVHIQNKRN